jgi:hypothetical protein
MALIRSDPGCEQDLKWIPSIIHAEGVCFWGVGDNRQYHPRRRRAGCFYIIPPEAVELELRILTVRGI